MAAASIGFANVLPEIYERYTPASTTQAITRKQEVVFIPDQNVNGFKPSTNNVIQFNIQSSAEMMVGGESYLEFDLTVTMNYPVNAGTDIVDGFRNLRMEMGGAHALFNRVEVKANVSSSTISLQELYNTAHVLQSRLRRVPSPGTSIADLDGFEQERPGVLANYVQQIGYQTIVSPAQQLTANTAPGLFPSALGTGAFSVDYNGPWHPVSTQQLDADITAPINTAGGQLSLTPIRVRLVLDTPVLQANLPLFLMPNGIQLALTLENPGRVFYMDYPTSSVTWDSSDNYKMTWEYSINNARFVAMMVQPTEDQVARFTQEYRSAQGLLYPTPAYKVLRTSVASTSNQSINISVLPGCRSLRYAIGGFWNSTVQMATSTVTSGASVSNHSHLPFYVPVEYYSWNIGATQFPSYLLRVQPTGVAVSATQSALLGATVLMKRIQQTFGIDQCELFAYFRYPLRVIEGTAGAFTAAPQQTMMYPGLFCQDFSRDNGMNSRLTGIDTSVSPLEFRCQLINTGLVNATAANLTWKDTASSFEFISFAWHDQWIRFSQSGTVVLN